MRRWLKWSAAAGSLIALVFVIPEGIEGIADSAARSRADGLSGELDWRGVEWFWTDTVRFTDVRGSVGPARDLRLRTLDVDLALLSTVAGEPKIQGFRAEGLETTVVWPSDEAERSAERTGGPAPTESRRSRLQQLAENLTWFGLEEASIELRRTGLPPVHWNGELTLRRSGAVRGSGTFRTRASGESSSIAWRLTGRCDIPARSATGELVLGPAGEGGAKGRVARFASPPLDATVDSLRFRVGRFAEGALATIEFADVTASVGGVRAPAARVAGPKLAVRIGVDRRIHLAGSSAGIELRPEKLLSLVGGGSDHGGSDRGGSDRGGSPGSGQGSPPGNTARLRQLFLSRVDLSLERTAFELLIRGDRGWKSYRPAERLSIRKRGRRIAAAGKFAGGAARGRVQFQPGRWVPAHASFRLRDIRLDEVPVVRKGRSLPSRGLRGEIGGRIDADGTLIQTGLPGTIRERVSGTVRLRWRDGSIRADGLARDPLRDIDLTLDVAAVWEPYLNRLQLSDSLLQFGPLEVELDGALVDRGLAPRLTFDARLREIACQRAVRALPDTLLGPYHDVAIEGRAAPHLSIDFPVDSPGDLSIDLDGFPGPCRPTALNAHSEGWPDVEFVHRPEGERRVPTASNSPVRQWAAAPDPASPVDPPAELEPVPSTWNPNRPDDVFWLREPFVKPVTQGVTEDADVRVGPGLASYVPLEALPTHVAGAAYLSEEINFYSDGGWNLRLIQKALQLDFREERFVYGGSTVTQQLVKNLFLTRRKTLDRKVQEALIAWRMQSVVSKDRALELYLNCIEYGENVYGIGPAARHYFQKDARELTPLEGVFLAVIKPAPWFGDRFRDDGTTPTSGWWRDRITEIMERLVQKGFVTEKRAEAAKPYVLRWDEDGRYLPEAPAPKAAESKDERADETDGAESSPRE